MQNSIISDQQANLYRGIYEQYCIDASFLWLLRSISVNQPHYNAEDLSELDQRINNNLDGLMCNFELAWQVCLDELAYEQAGEAFTAAIIAFRSRDINKIKYIIEHAFCNDETFKGVVSALAWLPKLLVNDWLQKFLYSKDLDHKYLAIAVCSIRRQNPGDVLKELLTREDCLAHHKLLTRSLRLIGELKLYSFVNIVEGTLQSEDTDIKFWANWALVLLGEHKRVLSFNDVIAGSSIHKALASQVAFKLLPIERSRLWVSEFSKQPELLRLVILATGYMGDPHVVPWLIDKMHHFETAKVAAEAFTMITGIDLVRYKLSIDAPEEMALLPSDDNEDGNVALDEDENLPFPDVNKINNIWSRYCNRYKAGRRYIMGVDFTENSPQVIEQLNSIYAQASMRQRNNIALTIALLNPTSPYLNSNSII